MSVSEELIITNNGNATAYYKWSHNPSKVFVPYPIEDEVAAGSTKKVKVTFNPPGPKCDDEDIILKIEDGTQLGIRCIGQVNEARCVFMEKQLDFGSVPVGLKTKDQTIHIKNQLRTQAVYQIINNNDFLTIYPMDGKIPADQKMQFTVGFMSNIEQDFQTEI